MAANYESAAGIDQIFQDAAAAGGVSAATAAAISELIKDLQTSGSNVAVEQVTASITSAAEVSAPIVMMGEGATVNATFGADSDVQAIVLNNPGGEGSNIEFTGDKAVTVQLGGADGDVVKTSGGDDSITFAGGSATVDTGSGNDTITLTGEGSVNIQQSGSGDMTIKLESDSVAATIDAGDGFDQLQVTSARDAFNIFFDTISGAFKMLKASFGRAEGDAVTMENVNIVGFGESDDLQEISVLATNEGQATVASIYQIAFDREAIDTAGGATNVDGLKFWFEDSANGLGGDGSGYTADQLDHVYRSMLECPEFAQKTGGMDDQAFVEYLMNNMGATTVNGQTATEYAAQLASGAVDRIDLTIQFAQSDEAMVHLGADGTGYVIEGWA